MGTIRRPIAPAEYFVAGIVLLAAGGAIAMAAILSGNKDWPISILSAPMVAGLICLLLAAWGGMRGASERRRQRPQPNPVTQNSPPPTAAPPSRKN
jgi:hypothetical protein